MPSLLCRDCDRCSHDQLCIEWWDTLLQGGSGVASWKQTLGSTNVIAIINDYFFFRYAICKPVSDRLLFIHYTLKQLNTTSFSNNIPNPLSDFPGGFPCHARSPSERDVSKDKLRQDFKVLHLEVLTECDL